MAEVICMGELLVEFVSSATNVAIADAPGFIKAPGGAPANVAVGLTKLGLPAAFIGKVGDDPFGVFLRRSLDQIGVDTRCLRVDDRARTTAVFVGVWDDGRKDVCFYRDPGADMMLTEGEVDVDLFGAAGCFHYGSISFIDEPAATAQHKALALARDNGLMISYDPNYRAPLWPNLATAQQVIYDGFRHCHLAKISEEEWSVATGGDDLDLGIDKVLQQGVELLLVSRGERGAMATNGDYRIDMPAPAVDVVETTGAGDGFMAAMISRLLPLRQKSGSLAAIDRGEVQDSLRFANAVGALTCTQRGAIPALPTPREVEAFMRRS